MSRTDVTEPVTINVSDIEFHDGSILSMPSGSVTLVVGPNNAGKSVLLGELAAHLSRLPHFGVPSSRTIRRVGVQKSGTYPELVAWLEKNGVRGRHPNNLASSALTYYVSSGEANEAQLKQSWELTGSLGEVARFVLTHQTTDARLAQASAVSVHNVEIDEPRQPLQILWMNASEEESFRALFKRAFGQDVSINRYVQTIDLKIGRPSLPDTAPPPSPELLAQYAALPSVMGQGDGIRSFTGLLLQVLVPRRHRIVLVDEPEAFLHPPQANLLARYLTERAPATTQLVLATHSQDVVQGALEAGAAREIQIVRLTRAATGPPKVAVLPPNLVRELTGDTFLQNSNVLNGLFHDAVIICEADADCTYYRVLVQGQYSAYRLPDLMYTQVGGKSRIAAVMEKFRKLGIPCASVVDFDVLSESPVLQRIVESAGGNWSDLEDDIQTLNDSVEDPAGPTVGSIRSAFNRAVAGLEATDRLDRVRKKTMSDAMRATTGWGALKRSGLHGVAQGPPQEATQRILTLLRSIGVFVVPVGELERWHPAISGKSNEWLATVLEQELHLQPDQTRADFVTKLVDFLGNASGRPAELFEGADGDASPNLLGAPSEPLCG